LDISNIGKAVDMMKDNLEEQERRKELLANDNKIMCKIKEIKKVEDSLYNKGIKIEASIVNFRLTAERNRDNTGISYFDNIILEYIDNDTNKSNIFKCRCSPRQIEKMKNDENIKIPVYVDREDYSMYEVDIKSI